MKKYIYLLIDEENEIHAAYDRIDLAKKLIDPISEKVKKELSIKKIQLNPDLAFIKENG